MKIILAMALIFFSLYAKKVKEDPIERIDLANGTTILRVHFNYVNSVHTIQRVRGIDGTFTLDFPLPNKWEILQAKGYIKYTPSILLLKDLSSAVVSFNDVVLTQFKIFDYKESGVKFTIDPALFYEHNMLKFEAIQHYTYKCEDGAHTSLWSDIDLVHSYIELLVRPKAIKEQISSIEKDVFDHKQYAVTPLNYILDTKSENEIKNFALFTSVASTRLKYRIEKIQVSNSIDVKNHNVIIASKIRAKEILKNLSGKYITDEKPSLSMFFNTNACNTWLNQSSYAKIEADKSVKIVKKGALFDKSLYLDNNRVKLTKIDKKHKENAVSVAFWFKPVNSKRGVLFGFDTYALMYNNGYIGFNTANKDLFGAKYKLKKNRWYHIVATFKDGEVQRNTIVINGTVLHLRKIHGDFIAANARFDNNAYIGGLGENKSVGYHGYIDQFYLFDHAITTIAAKKLYRYTLKNKKERATESVYLEDKIAHDINVLQNPYSIDKAIIVIAPEKPEKIRECIYALYKNDLDKYKRQGLDIKEVTIPNPAKAYSAKNFVPLDEKVYFKELGFKTTLLKGWYPDKLHLKFKVYPDNYFDAKDKIDTHLHMVLPTVVHDDSVINIYLNDMFAKQIDIIKTVEKSKIKIAADKLFNFESITKMPTYLIEKGFNELRLDFSLVPMKKGACEVYNTENLVASVLDDSYFILPKAKQWIEMPYMQLITSAQYPYSIYPDLQDSVIYFANKQNETIASAMNFLFFLTQELGSYPNYITMTDSLSKEDKEKNIIVFGSIYDKKLQELSKNAPIVFDNKVMHKDYPYISRYIEHENILNKDRLKKYRFLTKMQETNLVDSSIVMQMSRSPYNADKTVLSLSANSPTCLDKGIYSILQYRNRNNILGDLVVYDYVDQEGVAYNIKDKYILSKLSWFETVSLLIGAHPLRYIFFFIVLLTVFVWIVKVFLRKFKEEHHKDA